MPVHAAAPVAPPPTEFSPPAPAPAVSLGLAEAGQDEATAQMHALLETMLARRASDLHMSSDTVPHLRIDGDMVPLSEYGTLTPARLKAMVFSIAPNKNKEQWEKKHDTDFAYEMPGVARFRCNVFADRKGMGARVRGRSRPRS